jgi:hypothetical protein
VKKGTVLTDGRNIYEIRNCHKDGTYTVVTNLSRKYIGRFSEKNIKEQFEEVQG